MGQPPQSRARRLTTVHNTGVLDRAKEDINSDNAQSDIRRVRVEQSRSIELPGCFDLQALGSLRQPQ
jgi:hypothetical protein